MIVNKCPECGSKEVNSYRMPTGPIWCNDCGFRVEEKEFCNPFYNVVDDFEVTSTYSPESEKEKPQSIFDIQLTRNWDKGFCLGADPIWIHRHMEDKECPYHFHMLFNLGWWFVEIRIGRDYKEEEIEIVISYPEQVEKSLLEIIDVELKKENNE